MTVRTVLLALCIASSLVTGTHAASGSSSSSQSSSLATAKWMKAVRDKVLVKDLVLPGTHDACSVKVNDLAQTQHAGVATQLNQGIRFLDMRVGLCEGGNDQLCMFHGEIYLDMRFSEPVDDIFKFLRQNPSEGVILRLKHEHDGGDYEITDFQNFVERNYLSGKDQWFVKGKTAMNDLKVSDIRGRAVILWEDGNKTSKWGYDYNDVDTRKEYKFTKVDKLISTFKKRAEDALKADGWFENPTSGVLWLPDLSEKVTPLVPKSLAKVVNGKVQTFLTENPKTKGIISMDVPDQDLIKTIIDLNKQFFGSSSTTQSK